MCLCVPNGKLVGRGIDESERWVLMLVVVVVPAHLLPL